MSRELHELNVSASTYDDLSETDSFELECTCADKNGRYVVFDGHSNSSYQLTISIDRDVVLELAARLKR